MISKCYNINHNLQRVSKYTSIQTRLLFANGHILSHITYMLNVMSNAKSPHIAKLKKLIMYTARNVLGNYHFKKSIKFILDKLNWLPTKDLIHWSLLKSTHKLLYNKSPFSLYKLLKVKDRICAEVAPKNVPISKFSKNNYLYKGLSLYNRLPGKLKVTPPSKFKTQGLEHYKQNLRVN